MAEQPLLRVQLAFRVNLGAYNSADVTFGVSSLPFNATDDEIQEAMHTAGRVVDVMMLRARAEIARIRHEDPTRPVPPVDHAAFDPSPPTKAPEDEPLPDGALCSVCGSPLFRAPFDDVVTCENRHYGAEIVFDWKPASVAPEEPIEDFDDAYAAAPAPRMSGGLDDYVPPIDVPAATKAIEEVFGVGALDATPAAKPAPQIPTLDKVTFVDIPTAGRVLTAVEVYGVSVPIYGFEAFSEPASPEQIKALNTVLSHERITGKLRHRAAECLIDAWHEGRWGEEAMPRSVSTLNDLSRAEASICLEVLNATGAALSQIKADAHAREGQMALA